MCKVAIFEPNPYHSEVLPGITKYFEKLGFETDVYIREEASRLNVFARYEISGKILPYSVGDIPSIFSDENMGLYDFVFFSSMEHNENGRITRFLDELEKPPATKYGVLGLYHTNHFAENLRDHELLEQGRLFCMADFQKSAMLPFSVIVPLYFGKLGPARARSNFRKRLLIIGSSYDILILNHAYWKLNEREREKLEIIQVGTIQPKRSKIGKLARDYIKKFLSLLDKSFLPAPISYRGKLGFPELFDEIEAADYLLFAIDPSRNANQRHFMESSVSGSRQLSLGFAKPMIIHKDIASRYFEENACLPFETGKLDVTLRKVMSIDQTEYQSLCRSLMKNRDFCFDCSIKSLRKSIETAEKRQGK